MNKRQKEVIKYTLEQEKKIISELKDVYKKALEDIGEKIKILMSDEMTQSKIYQIEFQKALQGQISAILENMNSNQYERVYDYLKGCYEDGFIGTIYDLQGQGLPLILPLNQEEIVEALLIESKISEGLYTKMGNNVEVLKKNISFEIARGISTSSPYSQIARNLRSNANMTLNQSMRIVRTEGNRIHNKSALDACRRAKEAGADVFKMWDATLDGLTRPRHRQLDGQIREVTEDFEVDGLTVSAPLHFGIAAEDCNCRCHLLTKARWEMNESFTKWNNETAELMYFDNVKDYQDFKKNYWNHVDNSGKSGIIKEESGDVVTEITKLGTINTQLLKNEFGKLQTDEIIITNERIEHIKIRHPEDYKLFEEYGVKTIKNPDTIIKDCKNNGTVFMVKKLPETNLNVIVRLVLEEDNPKLKNSVMTFYRIRNKNLVKLENKNKTLYKKE